MSRRELVPFSTALPIAMNLTEVPDALYGAILQVEEPAVPYASHCFPAKIREIAQDHLDKMKPYMAPASAQLITKWIKPLITAAPNQRDGTQMMDWIEAVMLAMADVPIGVFSVQNQRAALRTLTFFPSPADIWNIVKDDVACLRKRETTLRLIIGSKS